MNCIALYHVAFEDLGSFAGPLRERGYAISYRHAGVDPLSPEEWTGADLVVVLGGPIGVGDMADYPWLGDELEGLRQRLASHRPTLGICLGAQLMAVALGGRIERRATGAEIGWRALDGTGQPGMPDLLRDVPVMHWHGENIVLPSHLQALASTPGTPVQAFAAGKHALGLQCHVEFAGATLEAWLIGHTVELRQAGVELARLRADTGLHAARLEQAGAALMRRWLDGLHEKPMTTQGESA
jgi:GMP synthase (glutamine-hydrolysing)